MKLLSDDIVAKYRSIPNFIWYIFAAISAFFANAYSYIISAGTTVTEFERVLAESELGITINGIAFIVITCIFSSIINELIFELINHIASGFFVARFSAKTSRADLKFRLRICYIYANFLTGLIGIAYFFTQVNENVYTGVFTPYATIQNDVETFLSYVVSFSSLTFFLYVFFEDTRRRFIPRKNQTRCLSFIGRIYFGIALVITLIRALSFVFNTISALVIASDWVDFGICVLWAGATYMYYLHLKKQPDDTADDTPHIIIEDKKDHNIYDDFGF